MTLFLYGSLPISTFCVTGRSIIRIQVAPTFSLSLNLCAILVPNKDFAWKPKTELLSIEILIGVFDSRIPVFKILTRPKL